LDNHVKMYFSSGFKGPFICSSLDHHCINT